VPAWCSGSMQWGSQTRQAFGVLESSSSESATSSPSRRVVLSGIEGAFCVVSQRHPLRDSMILFWGGCSCWRLGLANGIQHLSSLNSAAAAAPPSGGHRGGTAGGHFGHCGHFVNQCGLVSTVVIVYAELLLPTRHGERSRQVQYRTLRTASV
jgi:hypothetical protein